MTENTVRSAIGAALGYPMAEAAFRLVDRIESDVREHGGAPESTRHEVAAELADIVLDSLPRHETALLWVALDADNAGEDLHGTTDPTGTRMALDVFVVVERAVFAALEALAA